MPATITAFEHSPDRGRGLARDMRLRWALEEVGQDYAVKALSFAEMKAPEHIAIQPFGQIPTYQEGELVLFESGAIVLHIAERHAGLLPQGETERARAIAWMFAALNTVEPPIFERSLLMVLEREEPWFEKRLGVIEAVIRRRLSSLEAHLAARPGEGEWLEGSFSAGDLLMVSVLMRLAGSGLILDYPRLVDYVARAEARPAFERAFAAQRQAFEQASGG